MMLIIILLGSYEKACGAQGAAMASSGADVNIFGWANEAPEMPDYMDDWLEGIYCLIENNCVIVVKKASVLSILPSIIKNLLSRLRIVY